MRIKKDLETCSSCEEQQSLKTPTNQQEHKLLQTKDFMILRLPRYNNTKPYFHPNFWYVHVIQLYNNNNSNTNS